MQFYSIARDFLGQEEEPPKTADASTRTASDMFPDWQRIWFGDSVDSPELEEELWGFRADPDGDRIPNGLEFVSGGSPLESGEAVFVKLMISDGNAVFQFRELTSTAHSIEHWIEWSTDLTARRRDENVIRKRSDFDGVALKEGKFDFEEAETPFLRRVAEDDDDGK